MINPDWDRFKKEIWEDRCYDIGIKNSYYNLVVDLGANVGHFTRYIYPRANKVLSIEPSSINFPELQKNTEGMNRVRLFNFAIGKENGTRDFYDGDSIVYNRNIIDRVETKKFIDFIKENSIAEIDFLKCDIEGAEGEIFLIDDFKEIAKYLNHVVGEIHSGIELKTTFENNGFTYYQSGQIFTAQKI